MDTKRPLDTIEFQHSYNRNTQQTNKTRTIPRSAMPKNNTNTPSRKKIKGPKKGLNWGKFSDCKKQIIAFFLISGIMITGASAGLKAIDKYEEHLENTPVVELFDESIENAYTSSEFAISTLSKSQFKEYVQDELFDRVAEENIKEFLTESTKEIDIDIVLYLLTGEGNRFGMEDKEILETISQFTPYSQKVTFGFTSNEPKQILSYYSDVSQACTSPENQSDFIALVDAMASTSITNSLEALQHIQLKIDEINNEHTYIPSVEKLIETNNNFEKNVDANPALYAQPFYEFHNGRTNAAKSIVNKEILQNVKNPKKLEKLVKNSIYNEVENPYYASSQYSIVPFSPTPEQHENLQDYKNSHIPIRNQLYLYAIDLLNGSEQAKEQLAELSENIANRLDAYNHYNSRNPNFLKELHKPCVQFQKAQQEKEEAQQAIRNTGFDDFSR